MAFIQSIPEDRAAGLLAELYAADLKNQGYVSNPTRAMSLRPEVIAAWRNLVGAIRTHLDLRRYELVTMAAARALRCTY